MKKKYGVILICYIYLAPIIGFTQQEKLSYKEENNTLLLGTIPIPPWVDIIINLEDESLQYSFIPIFFLPFNIWGWKKIDQTIDLNSTYHTGSFKVDEEYLNQGWFYSNQKPSNIPDGWFYSPTYSLYFNLSGIQKLDRFFKDYLGEILPLSPSVTQNIKINQFVRLILEPDTNIAFVNLSLPENMVIAYKTTLPQGTGQRIFVLDMIYPPDPNNLIQVIKGGITYKDGSFIPILYKVKYIEDTTS